MEKIVSLRPKKVYVDLGYKEKDHHPEDVQVYLSNKSRKKMTRWKKMWMNRKSTIVISHLKQDHKRIGEFKTSDLSTCQSIFVKVNKSSNQLLKSV